MRILFTKSSSPLSVAIRYLTGEPVSHVALQIGSLVFHSNLYGVHTDFLEDFLTASEVVYSVEVETRYDVTTQMHHSLYDYGSLFYLGLCYILHRFLRIRLPKANLWAASGMYTCTEWVTYVITGEEDKLITPYQLYQKLLLKQEKLKEGITE